jgi:hypothetical protein
LIELSENELSRVWDAIDQKSPYDWSVGRKSAERLTEITTAVHGHSSRDELSTVLGPLLSSDSKHRVAHWIIRDWGGIRGLKDDNVAMMVAGLGDYSDATVDAFVTGRKSDRISSWSKLLAFRNGEKWAIYDSRTAVALNAALIAIDREPSFEMPISRNTKIGPKRAKIASLQRQVSMLGYPSYLSILRALRDHQHLKTVGDVEMVLFANAEAIVSNMRM